MILTIDIGNTRVKWLMYQDEVVVEGGAFEYTVDTFRDCFVGADILLENVDVVVSNVAGIHIEKLLTEILAASRCKNYAYAQARVEQCGVINSYVDYSRLGVDRWLAMITGFKHEKRAEDEFVCIIDCGTAMTLDVVDNSGRHLGGVITPGYRLMQSMLAQKTDGINESVGFAEDSSMGLANTTDDAIRQGCVQLLVGGLSEMLVRYSKNRKNKMCCIVTGGDGAWVAKILKIETLLEPMLVNKGLWYVSRELLKAKTKGCI